jgi:hypothetical protein
MAHHIDPQSILDSSLQIVKTSSNVAVPPDDSISATAEATIYRSLPLVGTKSTRVLRILPIELQDGDNITCQLEVISLDDDPPPEYFAVSYEWGSASETRHITINSVPFVVRKNLWAFLDNTRKRDFRGMLWTDAICINQTSISERNHQVSMMGDIYRSATRVLVWLGLESAIVPSISDDPKGPSVEMPDLETYSQEGLLDSMRLMAFDFLKHQEMLEGMGKEFFLKTEEELWETVFSKRHAMLSLLIEKMEQLFGVGYWKRMWIVQEYSLAREITLQTDRSEMAGALLRPIFDMILHAVTMDSQLPGADLDLSDRLADLPTTILMMATNLSGRGLADLIKMFTNRGCSDQRDHIYALLSLARPEDLATFELSPDYGKSELELFIELTYKHVRVRGFANSLHASEHAFGKALGIDPEIGRLILCGIDLMIMYDNETGRCRSPKKAADELIHLGVEPPPSTPGWIDLNRRLSVFAAAGVSWQESDEEWKRIYIIEGDVQRIPLGAMSLYRASLPPAAERDEGVVNNDDDEDSWYDISSEDDESSGFIGSDEDDGHSDEDLWEENRRRRRAERAIAKQKREQENRSPEELDESL